MVAPLEHRWQHGGGGAEYFVRSFPYQLANKTKYDKENMAREQTNKQTNKQTNIQIASLTLSLLIKKKKLAPKWPEPAGGDEVKKIGGVGRRSGDAVRRPG